VAYFGGEIQKYSNVVDVYKKLVTNGDTSTEGMLRTFSGVVDSEISIFNNSKFLRRVGVSKYNEIALYNTSYFNNSDIFMIENHKDGGELIQLFKGHPFSYTIKYPLVGDLRLFAEDLTMGTYRCYGGSQCHNTPSLIGRMFKAGVVKPRYYTFCLLGGSGYNEHTITVQAVDAIQAMDIYMRELKQLGINCGLGDIRLVKSRVKHKTLI